MDACCKAFPGIRKAESLHNLLMVFPTILMLCNVDVSWKDADIVLLGVKPQNVEAVLKPLKAEVGLPCAWKDNAEL